MIRETSEPRSPIAPSPDPREAPPIERAAARETDPVALRAAAELTPDRRSVNAPAHTVGVVPRAPITVLCPHCSHACDPAAGIACVRCGAYVGAGIADLRRSRDEPPESDAPESEVPDREPTDAALTEAASTELTAESAPPEAAHSETAPGEPARGGPALPGSVDDAVALGGPPSADPELLAGFAQIGRAAADAPLAPPRFDPPAIVPPFPSRRGAIDATTVRPQVNPNSAPEPFVVRAPTPIDPAPLGALEPRRRFARRPPGLHSSEIPERHNWLRTITTLVLLAVIAVIAGRIMFTKDPANEPILGSSASAGVVDPTDRAEARPAAPGGETMLLQVHRAIASLARNGDGWASVTPAEIGKSIDTIGILGPERPPTRVDEISLAIDPDEGVTLGAFDSDVAAGDCVWLRDTGNGPDVARDEGSGNCTAAAAPMAGWEPILP